MNDCPNCEYHRQRAQLWREEAYKLSGHPLPEQEYENVKWNTTRDEVLEEVAEEFERMRIAFGDTAHSFAQYVREMKNAKT
jgi:hypothetical protein